MTIIFNMSPKLRRGQYYIATQAASMAEEPQRDVSISETENPAPVIVNKNGSPPKSQFTIEPVGEDTDTYIILVGKRVTGGQGSHVIASESAGDIWLILPQDQNAYTIEREKFAQDVLHTRWTAPPPPPPPPGDAEQLDRILLKLPETSPSQLFSIVPVPMK